MRLVTGIVSLIVLCLMIFSGPAGAEEREYSFGVVPQSTPLIMHDRWSPFIDRLSASTGVKFSLKVYKSFNDFEDALHKGDLDFAFMTPIQQATPAVSDKYIPLVRNTTRIAGILFVKNESPIKSAEDLKNGTIAFVGVNNVCSILVSNLLAQVGAADYTPIFAGSTDNIVKNVLIGKSQAGSFLDISFERLPEETKAQLRILVETQKIPSHPISAHKRVPAELREKVRQLVLDMGNDPSAEPLLKTVGMPSPVRADYTKDYRPTAKYGLHFAGKH